MNKFIIIIMILSTTLTSCKKYTCTCLAQGTMKGSTYVSSVTNYYTTDSNASRKCAANGVNCSLK